MEILPDPTASKHDPIRRRHLPHCLGDILRDVGDDDDAFEVKAVLEAFFGCGSDVLSPSPPPPLARLAKPLQGSNEGLTEEMRVGIQSLS